MYLKSKHKPLTRWWWFADPITKEDIRLQLDWLKSNNFGGVEIAWIYHTKGEETPVVFLEQEWQDLVEYAIQYASHLGLSCDLTLGSIWPFGGSFLPPEFTSQTIQGPSPQKIDRAWENAYNPNPVPVLDHLGKNAVAYYMNYFFEHGFRKFSNIQKPMVFFSDSWEVEGDVITEGFKDAFTKQFGYVLPESFAETERSKKARYDYRKLCNTYILRHFFAQYTELCHREGVQSRVQCHGAPVDLLQAYTLVDIPETETLLFDPDFALIASSAATISGKAIVTSETFTCPYGWVPTPAKPPGLKEEDVLDLKAIADAQFAWGVNHVIWHGMPFSTPRKPKEFYATTHVGPDGALASHFKSFNSYLAQVSKWMKKGKTYAPLAVYLPLEDQWMQGELPAHLKKISSNHHWELQECKMPTQYLPYCPQWISAGVLTQFHGKDGKIANNHVCFEKLLVDCTYLDSEALDELIRIHNEGGTVLLLSNPTCPGTLQNSLYEEKKSKIATEDLKLENLQPVIKSNIPLEYHMRQEGIKFYVFIANPQTQKLRYPMNMHFSRSYKPLDVTTQITLGGTTFNLNLVFKAHESKLIEFQPAKDTYKYIPLPKIDTP